MGAGLLELLLDRGRDQPAARTRDARGVRSGVAGIERTQGVCADGRVHRRLYADPDGARDAWSLSVIDCAYGGVREAPGPVRALKKAGGIPRGMPPAFAWKL